MFSAVSFFLRDPGDCFLQAVKVESHHADSNLETATETKMKSETKRETKTETRRRRRPKHVSTPPTLGILPSPSLTLGRNRHDRWRAGRQNQNAPIP